MYTVSKEDGTLNKDGQMCYCIYTETSCTTSCAAFEERVKDRAFLHCCGREIIAKPEMPKELDWAKPAPPPKVKEVADPLGLDAKPVRKKMTAPTKKRGAK